MQKIQKSYLFLSGRQIIEFLEMARYRRLTSTYKFSLIIRTSQAGTEWQHFSCTAQAFLLFLLNQKVHFVTRDSVCEIIPLCFIRIFHTISYLIFL